MKGYRLNEVRTCRHCERSYAPSKKEQQFCSVDCGAKAKHARTKGQPMAKAVAARKKIHNDYVRALLALEFGPVTERDVRLFVFAHTLGYDRGHAKGYYAARKRSAA